METSPPPPRIVGSETWRIGRAEELTGTDGLFSLTTTAELGFTFSESGSKEEFAEDIFEIKTKRNRSKRRNESRKAETKLKEEFKVKGLNEMGLKDC